MGTKIHIGVNLSFAKYVYGRKRALQIARRRLGLTCAEIAGVMKLSQNTAASRYRYGLEQLQKKLTYLNEARNG